MLVLSAFHVAQGMDEKDHMIAHLKAQNEKLEKEQFVRTYHSKKLTSVLQQMREYRKPGHWCQALIDLDKETEQKFDGFKELLTIDRSVHEQFWLVIGEIYNHNLKCSPGSLDRLQAEREEALQELLKTQIVWLKDEAEEVQGCELPDGLGEAFEDLFAADQDKACEDLINSIASMQALLDNEELATNAVETIQPITVGWGTWLKYKILDKVLGARYLISELTPDKLSAEVLKKSPDMQKRINDVIASYSPSHKRNPAMLLPLAEIYTPLAQINFKLVDSKVNSDIYNACSKWLVEEEGQHASIRKAFVFAIAKTITSELKRMHNEEAPRIETMMALDQLKELTKKTGMVAVDGEEKAADEAEPRVLEIIGRLEELSEALLQEEEFKKLFA